MLPRFRRDYGTMKCGYCKREVERTHANSKFCCHNCSASDWYDRHKRVGPKPERIILPELDGGTRMRMLTRLEEDRILRESEEGGAK